jgi:hypothetical protein
LDAAVLGLTVDVGSVQVVAHFCSPGVWWAGLAAAGRVDGAEHVGSHVTAGAPAGVAASNRPTDRAGNRGGAELRFEAAAVFAVAVRVAVGVAGGECWAGHFRTSRLDVPTVARRYTLSTNLYQTRGEISDV